MSYKLTYDIEWPISGKFDYLEGELELEVSPLFEDESFDHEHGTLRAVRTISDFELNTAVLYIDGEEKVLFDKWETFSLIDPRHGQAKVLSDLISQHGQAIHEEQGQ